MITDSVILFLRASDEVRDDVGTRIYDTVAPQRAEYPLVTVQELSCTPVYDLQGETGKARSAVQVDCWAEGAKAAVVSRRVGETVRNRLSGYRGEMDGVRVSVGQITRYTKLVEEPDDASDDYTHRVSMDIDIVHTQSVPDFT